MAGSTEQEFELEEFGPKKKEKVEEKQIDLGPLLMAALAILLLAFFILLVSMATVDSNKRKIVLKSLKGTFGVLDGGSSMAIGDGLAVGGLAQEQIHFMTSIAMFQTFVKAKGFEEKVFIDGSNKGFTISVDSETIFKPGEAKLLAKHYRILDLVKFIIADSQKKFRVRIEGHTDDLPTKTEKFPSNWELSVARAIAALRYIVRDTAINVSQVEAAGYAGYRPKVPNTSPKNRARNRRVDIAFLSKDEAKNLNPQKSIEVGGFKFQF